MSWFSKAGDWIGDAFGGTPVHTASSTEVDQNSEQAKQLQAQFLAQLAATNGAAAPQVDTAMFQSAAEGNAPSAAAIQMQQGQEEALRQSMAMQASQRGSYSPAVARQALAVNAQASQQANQQAGLMRAQEQAAARTQFLQALQGNQSAYLQNQAQTYQAQQGIRQSILGALGTQQQNASTKYTGQNQANMATAANRQTAMGGVLNGAGSLMSSMSGMFSGSKGGGGTVATAGSPGGSPTSTQAGASVAQSGDGQPIAGESYTGETVTAAHGGFIPGKAKVKGDSPKNDTVPAQLSPGELVVPRSVVAQGPAAIAKFAQAAAATPIHYGHVLQAMNAMHERMSALEAKKGKKSA